MRALSLSLAGLLVAAGTAHAHPTVDRARDLAMNAEFEAALEAFERAESENDLTRDDLIQLLSARAYVHYAMDNREELVGDVRRLATLDPDHAFDVSVPPEVQEMHRAEAAGLSEPLGLDAEAVREVGGTITVRAFTRGDEGHLVRSVRVFVRVGDDSDWALGDRTVSIPVETGDDVHFYSEAVGPGGAVVAMAHGPDAPGRVEVTGGGVVAPPAAIRADPPGGDDQDGVPVWVWVAGGGAAAALAIVLVVLLSGESLTDNTQPTGPIVVDMGM